MHCGDFKQSDPRSTAECVLFYLNALKNVVRSGLSSTCHGKILDVKDGCIESAGKHLTPEIFF